MKVKGTILEIIVLAEALGFEEAVKRLSGEGPAGTLPASCSRSRGAAEEQVSQQDYTTGPPFPDQGGGEVQRLERQWYDEEAVLRKRADDYMKVGRSIDYGELKRQAEELAMRRAQLRAALGTQPLTQSGEGGNEGCPRCKSNEVETATVILKCKSCSCIWDARSERERSESGNAKADEHE